MNDESFEKIRKDIRSHTDNGEFAEAYKKCMQAMNEHENEFDAMQYNVMMYMKRESQYYLMMWGC